jgi:uncharacterized protein YraI
MRNRLGPPRRTMILLSTALAFFAATLLALSAFAQSAMMGVVRNGANLRAGAGTSYAIVGKAQPGQNVVIVGKNEAGDWYQLAGGHWIAAFLVDTTLITTTTPVSPVFATSLERSTISPVTTSATALRDANLRSGPGVRYPLAGTVTAGQRLILAGKNEDGSWLKLENGVWIASFLVDQSAASLSAVTSTEPASTNPVTATVSPAVTTEQATNGNEFIVIEQRLWDPNENGGGLDGPSVHCGYGRELIVNVLDANGGRMNGIAVQVQYGAREIYVTGAQGKGDGVAEFVLGSGQDVAVIRDHDGRLVTSDVATGLVTRADAIPFATLIAARYCQDEATCRAFAANNSCYGHFSWTVTFQRRP